MNHARFTPAGSFAILLAALGAVSVSAQATPALDSARLMTELSVLAHDSMAGRATGTPGAQRAQAFLSGTLEDAGIAPAGAELARPFTWPGGTGVNLVAELPGRSGAGGQVIVLSAHYDHLGIRSGRVFNGADDNASGVAALLEIGRALIAEPLEHTVLLAFFDAEEQGLRGARAFVADPPVPLDRIALNVNLDMVARTDGLLWAGGAYHTPALEPILEEVATGAPVKLRLGHDRPGAPEGDDWTSSSDHGPFHRAGIPFVYFGVEDHVDYHRPSDDFTRVDPGEFVAAVRTIMSAIRALDAALPLVEDSGR